MGTSAQAMETEGADGCLDTDKDRLGMQHGKFFTELTGVACCEDFPPFIGFCGTQETIGKEELPVRLYDNRQAGQASPQQSFNEIVK
ncbi:hypothetical protein AOLI_G00247010 [Acnodon oligacanthus]